MTGQTPQLIAVDVGNHSTKFGIVDSFDSTTCTVLWKQMLRWPVGEVEVGLPRSACTWVACSVNDHRFDEFRLWIEQTRPEDRLVQLSLADIPLRITSEPSSGIGLDRLCAATAASGLASPNAAIVVDAGTAVTVDAVTGDGEFLGGTIFLGIQGEFDQLAKVAHALPRLAVQELHGMLSPLSRETRQAMESGVILSKAGGISELVERIADSFADPPSVFLTGGDGPLLQPLLRFECNRIDELVLMGVMRAAATSHGLVPVSHF